MPGISGTFRSVYFPIKEIPMGIFRPQNTALDINPKTKFFKTCERLIMRLIKIILISIDIDQSEIFTSFD